MLKITEFLKTGCSMKAKEEGVSVSAIMAFVSAK